LEKRHDLPVRSVLVLLRPGAQLSVLSGDYQRALPGSATPYRTFRYEVLRVWEMPVERLLSGGIGTLPLAPISAVAATELPDVLRRVKRKLSNHPDRGLVARLWTAVYVLMGLRYEQALVEQLLQGVMGMKESVTYQAIIAEGKAEGAIEELRKVLLSLGEEQFRAPAPAWAAKALARIDSLERLETLARQVLHAKSWAELLPEGQSQRGKKRES
jgi:predicted transposase YdaD